MSPSVTPSPPPSKEPPDKGRKKRLFASPRPTLETSIADPDQDQPAASPSVRPPFAPFFTLITDTTTSTTYHPRYVHYIFSDDDPGLLTTACIEALNPPSTSSSIARSQRYPNPSPSSSSTTSKSPSSSTAIHVTAPNTRTEKENRILLLDLDASGQAVTRAHSLSSSWQILSTSLTPAPTWAESPSEPYSSSSPSGAGFMLKISGTDGSQASSASIGTGREEKGEGKGTGKAAGTALTENEFQTLMHDFDQRMKVLRTVVEAGNDIGNVGEPEVDNDVEKDRDRDIGEDV